MHEAVLDVVCRAAALMGTLCGENRPRGAAISEVEARALAKEATFFVTQDMRVLFGAIVTTKMHALAYLLLEELERRCNLIEADTSISAFLHKFTKVFYARSKKSTTSFLVQMLRCEQTLGQVVAQDIGKHAKADSSLDAI